MLPNRQNSPVPLLPSVPTRLIARAFSRRGDDDSSGVLPWSTQRKTNLEDADEWLIR